MRQPARIESVQVQHGGAIGKKLESSFLKSLRVKKLLASPGVKRCSQQKPAKTNIQK